MFSQRSVQIRRCIVTNLSRILFDNARVELLPNKIPNEQFEERKYEINHYNNEYRCGPTDYNATFIANNIHTKHKHTI